MPIMLNIDVLFVSYGLRQTKRRDETYLLYVARGMLLTRFQGPISQFRECREICRLRLPILGMWGNMLAMSKTFLRDL